MADNVIIQNGAGEEVVYENVSGVELLTEDGETATFVHDAEILYENLPDKPFGNIPVVLEETEIPFKSYEEFNNYNAEFIVESEAIPDETYKVNWDGTEYLCVCHVGAPHLAIGDLADNDLCWFGNQTLFWNMGEGTDTGEPFCIYMGTNDAGELALVIETLDTSATHMVSITPVNEVTKIDKKYLPDDIGTGGSAELPVFDLTAMGLPAIPLDGTHVSVGVDTTEIRSAAAKGLIKAKLTAADMSIEAMANLIYIPAADYYAYSGLALFNEMPFTITVDFYSTVISAYVTALAKATT